MMRRGEGCQYHSFPENSRPSGTLAGALKDLDEAIRQKEKVFRAHEAGLFRQRRAAAAEMNRIFAAAPE